jgi:putative NADH-flavin reductase
MKIVLIGANGKIGELVQKALAGAGHEIVKVGRKSAAFTKLIERPQRLIRRPSGNITRITDYKSVD